VPEILDTILIGQDEAARVGGLASRRPPHILSTSSASGRGCSAADLLDRSPPPPDWRGPAGENEREPARMLAVAGEHAALIVAPT
jgi:hypothetical protein